jgi:hypothetical protein
VLRDCRSGGENSLNTLSMKTTPLADLDQAPWLAGVVPIQAIRLHPRRGLRSFDPGSSKMGWPFLWPSDEPWPVCTQQDPGMLAMAEAGVKQVDLTTIDVATQEIVANVMGKWRDGHNVPYLPVLQLRRTEYPDLPFPDDTDLFQLLWCPMIHFEGNGGFLLYWRKSAAIETSNGGAAAGERLPADPFLFARSGEDSRLSELPGARIHADSLGRR